MAFKHLIELYIYFQPSDDYTEPQSGSEDYSRVETPLRTASLASQSEPRSLSRVATPEQTPKSTSSSLCDDVVNKNVTGITSGHVIADNQDDEVEEG